MWSDNEFFTLLGPSGCGKTTFYAGHRFARELDMPDIGDQLPFRREITQLHLETS